MANTTPKQHTKPGKKPSAKSAAFRRDPMYPRIQRVVAAILQNGKVVTPVDVLIGMELLTRQSLEDWRRGRVPYLERLINCNLTKLSRLLRILRFHVENLNLKPSTTVYMRHGKGPKQRLRFSKTGDSNLEQAYSTHFVWPGKGPFKPPGAKDAANGAETDSSSEPQSPLPASPPADRAQ